MNNKFRGFILKVINNKFFQNIFYSPFVDYHQWSLLKFVKACALFVKPGQSIIDVGAGELKYKPYFSQCNYLSQDLCVGDNTWNFEKIDIKSSIYEIPCDSSSFDYVLCTQVLEHLENPDKAFFEFSRLLKSGGRLFLSAPLGFAEHQVPYDFFRYTQYGLKVLGERNGFRLLKIEPQGGIFINLEYIFWQAINTILPFKKYSFIRYLYFVLILPFKILTGIISVSLDCLDFKKQYTINYNCVYEKIG